MAIEDFVQSLLLGQAAKEQIAAADPYARGSNFFNNQLGGAVQQAAQNPTYSTKDKLIAGLVTGLIGGGFDGLSSDYQGRAKTAYDDVLKASMTGSPVTERPGVLDRSLFSTAQNQGSVFRTMQDLKNADTLRAYKQERAGKIEDVLLNKTGTVYRDGEKIQLFDPNQMDIQKTVGETIAKLNAEDGYYNRGSAGAPAPPKVALITDPSTGEAIATSIDQPPAPKPATLADLDPRSPEAKRLSQIFEIERGYTKELLDGTQGKQVLQMNIAAKNIMEALKSDNPTAASTAIVEYAKLQDPMASVRESDELRVSDAGGPLGRLAQMRNEMLQKGKLTPDVKIAMRELVPMLLKNKFAEYDQVKNAYLEAANAQGLSRDRIKYISPADLSEYLNEQQGAAGGSGGGSLQEAALAELARRRSVKPTGRGWGG